MWFFFFFCLSSFYFPTLPKPRLSFSSGNYSALAFGLLGQGLKSQNFQSYIYWFYFFYFFLTQLLVKVLHWWSEKWSLFPGFVFWNKMVFFPVSRASLFTFYIHSHYSRGTHPVIFLLKKNLIPWSFAS